MAWLEASRDSTVRRELEPALVMPLAPALDGTSLVLRSRLLDSGVRIGIALRSMVGVCGCCTQAKCGTKLDRIEMKQGIHSEAGRS